MDKRYVMKMDIDAKADIWLELDRVYKEETGKGRWKLIKILDPRDKDTPSIEEDVLINIPRESAEDLAEGLNKKLMS